MPETRPYTTFNFLVEIILDGSGNPLCSAAFSECSGLEMSMQPKTYQEGGNNTAQVHLAGPTTYGQLSLKRGMTDSFDLWYWFDRVVEGDFNLRASAIIVMHDSEHRNETVRFLLSRCMPVRIKAPALQAREGLLAIEEMQIAYERLQIQRP